MKCKFQKSEIKLYRKYKVLQLLNLLTNNK